MATKTIDHLALTVGVTPYEHEGNSYDALRVSVIYSKGYGFYVSWQPVKLTQYGYQTGPMPSQDPLVGGGRFIVERVQKNNSKRLTEMHAALELAKADIAWLFDERMFTQLQQFVKDVALCGYNENLKSQISNLKNQKNTTMTNEAFKAADLIGKVIIVGNNQGTITVKSVQDNGMLACEFSKAGEDATTPMTVTIPNLQKMQERGLWKLQTSDVSPKTSEVTTEADVAEVSDIVPVVTKKKVAEAMVQAANGGPATTMPLGEHGTLVIAGVGGTKADGGSMKSEEKPQPSCVPLVASEQSSSAAIKHQTSKDKLQYVTYEVRKVNKATGKDYTVTGSKIVGFELTDPVYLAGPSFNGAIHTEQQDGKMVGVLRFSHKWTPAVKEVCDKLNAGGTIEDCVAIITGAKDARWQRIQERIAKREERKAAREANTDSTDKTDKPTAPAMDEKEQAIFELFKKFMAGDATAMQQVGAMMAKQAA